MGNLEYLEAKKAVGDRDVYIYLYNSMIQERLVAALVVLHTYFDWIENDKRSGDVKTVKMNEMEERVRRWKDRETVKFAGRTTIRVRVVKDCDYRGGRRLEG